MTDWSTIFLSNTAVPSCGTLLWMSPELLDPTYFGSDGLPSRQSDCYALGMTIYEVNHFFLFWSPLTYATPGT
jgi:serine/threonine protein kinase